MSFITLKLIVSFFAHGEDMELRKAHCPETRVPHTTKSTRVYLPSTLCRQLSGYLLRTYPATPGLLNQGHFLFSFFLHITTSNPLFFTAPLISSISSFVQPAVTLRPDPTCCSLFTLDHKETSLSQMNCQIT